MAGPDKVRVQYNGTIVTMDKQVDDLIGKVAASLTTEDPSNIRGRAELAERKMDTTIAIIRMSRGERADPQIADKIAEKLKEVGGKLSKGPDGSIGYSGPNISGPKQTAPAAASPIPPPTAAPAAAPTAAPAQPIAPAAEPEIPSPAIASPVRDPSPIVTTQLPPLQPAPTTPAAPTAPAAASATSAAHAQLTVQQQQAYLKVAGFDVGKHGLDGTMGPDTQKAMDAFAKKNGIDPKDTQKINDALMKSSQTAPESKAFVDKIKSDIATGKASPEDIKAMQWVLKANGAEMSHSQKHNGTMDGIAGSKTKISADVVAHEMASKTPATPQAATTTPAATSPPPAAPTQTSSASPTNPASAPKADFSSVGDPQAFKQFLSQTLGRDDTMAVQGNGKLAASALNNTSLGGTSLVNVDPTNGQVMSMQTAQQFVAKLENPALDRTAQQSKINAPKIKEMEFGMA